MINKIYIVKEHGGSYDDVYTHNLCAFLSEEEARRYVTTLGQLDEWWLNKAQRILDEFQPKMDIAGKYKYCYDIQMELYNKMDCYYDYEEVELIGNLV